MYELKVKVHFDAAHHLVGYEGKCQRIHGHRWDVELALVGYRLDHLNMLVDFSTVKKELKGLIDGWLDHYDLNESLSENCPTAEYLAEWLFNSILASTSFSSLLTVNSVTIWESPECSITYSKP